MELSLTLTHLHVERDQQWITTAQNYLKWKTARVQAELQEKQYSDALKALSDGVASKGGGYVFTPEWRKGTVDYKAVPELKGVNLEPYRKDGVEVWKLTYEIPTTKVQPC